MKWWGGWRGWLVWLALAVPVIAINSFMFYVLRLIGTPEMVAYWLSVPAGSLPTYIVCTALMSEVWKNDERK